WKSLESPQSYLNNSEIQTEMLSKFSNQIYLDDVILPPKYAVTDGGQSTVPFIEAQSVETYSPFALSGIGLFYRRKDGCGGYIAPRLFTIDISQYN
ncbi:hypothetical protein PV325_013796, partial [Microctonus aethiopoides]